jgi:hypothetical protein
VISASIRIPSRSVARPDERFLVQLGGTSAF